MIRPLLRLAGRLLLVAAVACGLALIGIQFEGILAKNVATASDITSTQLEITRLRRRESAQQRTLKRLASPEGSIPEIHERLRLVAPNEEIIYVHGTPAPESGEVPGAR